MLGWVCVVLLFGMVCAHLMWCVYVRLCYVLSGLVCMVFVCIVVCCCGCCEVLLFRLLACVLVLVGCYVYCHWCVMLMLCGSCLCCVLVSCMCMWQCMFIL